MITNAILPRTTGARHLQALVRLHAESWTGELEVKWNVDERTDRLPSKATGRELARQDRLNRGL